MKKLIIALIAIVLVAVVSFCIYDAMFYNAWSALKELPRFRSKEIYSVDNFTDCTYYAKFTYRNVSEEDLKNAEYFEKITEDNMEEILVFINGYESFINNIGGMDEIKNSYDFDKEVINENDHYYTKKNGQGFIIALYYFDMESQNLYYFHYCI